MDPNDIINALAVMIAQNQAQQPRSFVDSWAQDFPAEYDKYNTAYPGAKEVLGWAWWDTQTYVSGTTTQLTQWFNIRATPDLSNMEAAFALPAPKAFLLRAIRLFFKVRPRVVTPLAAGGVATGVMDNVAQLINTGVFTFTIGSKPYAMLPLWTMTPGGGATGVIALSGGPASTGTTVDYAQSGVSDPRAIQAGSKPLFIQPQMNFTATVTWPAALTLAGGNIDVTFLLDGDLVRAIQ